MCRDWKVFTGPEILGAAWREGSTHDQPKDLQPGCRVHVYNLEITSRMTQLPSKQWQTRAGGGPRHWLQIQLYLLLFQYNAKSRPSTLVLLCLGQKIFCLKTHFYVIFALDVIVQVVIMQPLILNVVEKYSGVVTSQIIQISSLEQWCPLHETPGMCVENSDTQASLQNY